MELKRAIQDLVRYSHRRLRYLFKIYDSEETIISEAGEFWNDPKKIKDGQYSHFRGSGIFADDARWLSVGKQSLDIFLDLSQTLQSNGPMEAALEWGCGGGANAVHFAPLVKKFYGLDISADCLTECAKQLEREGFPNHQMILVEAANPESVLTLISEPLDLFLSIYVFELLPSEEYATRIIRIANKMLRPGGLAFLQFKYSTEDIQSKTRRWNYGSNPANMVTFQIDKFWNLCEREGLSPQVLKLVPFQPLVSDSRYGYILCRKST